jgi:response regulator RpfG family c-di-GMP phosphodiesterase/HAMP domain-containing protein
MTARRFPLHIHISTLFLILLLAVGGVIGGLGYSASRSILKASATTLSERIGRETSKAFSGMIGPAEMAAALLCREGVTRATTLEQRLAHLPFMREALDRSVELVSLYAGYANGDFFLLRRLAGAAERGEFSAPPATTYVVQSIDHLDGEPRGRYIFLDAALSTLRVDERPDYAASFDPRARDWYAAAMATSGQVTTPPYVFFTTRKVGTTIAYRDAASVVGADIQLETLDQMLARQKVTPATQIALVSPRSGEIIAHEKNAQALQGALQSAGSAARPRLASLASFGVPVLAQVAAPVRDMQGDAALNVELTAAGEVWHVALTPLQIQGSGSLLLITAIPDRELMSAAYALLRHAALFMLAVVLLAIPVIWLTARAVSKPLRKLAGEVDAIRHFEFEKSIDVESRILEVGELAQTIATMKRTISRFLDLSMAVAAENDFDRLLPHLLGETIAAAGARAGVLYLLEDDRLRAASGLHTDGRALPDSSPSPGACTASPLLRSALASGEARVAPLASDDVAALDLADVLADCGAGHAIAVPLQNRQNALVGAMVLLRDGPIDAAQLSFVDALCGSAAVSLEAKELIRAQKRLFEAMIRLIAGAIDAKSPYTGGHCARVPEIAKRIARAACAQRDGPFAGFTLDDDGWEALHIAAWLHDCGKVTTPEYVVDKATKLETIYDRIHEIRMRFEVLKRDAHIACLEAIAAGEAEATARERLTAEWAQLDDDFAFVAACNEGGEAMQPEHLQRLQAIATRRWRRTLDDRLGVSRDEAQRRARTPPPALPVDEPLLADKPEHRIERGTLHADEESEAAQRLGVRMPAPELVANRGELYNLSIARGTLNAEERYRINEHIVQTLLMLDRLPFPKHLRDVPEIAGGHHEKIDGSGYPRRLTGDQMSVLARLMAIADIFEALTAVDRPYKPGKTLSQTLAIMARMRDEKHIDAELFALFVTSGACLDYARRFMQAAQLDTDDVAALRAAAGLS